MVEAIKNALAVKRLKRAGIFVEMRVVDRGGVPQARFLVKHHGVTNWLGRRSAVGLAKAMQKIEWRKEVQQLVMMR